MFRFLVLGLRQQWKKNNSEKKEFSRFPILLNIYYDYELNYSQTNDADAR